jgi:hypothetical protein
MSDTKLKERIVAWKRAAERQQLQADVLERARRVARASGCPKGQPPVRWLISKGPLVDTSSGYAFPEGDKAVLGLTVRSGDTGWIRWSGFL